MGSFFVYWKKTWYFIEIDIIKTFHNFKNYKGRCTSCPTPPDPPRKCSVVPMPPPASCLLQASISAYVCRFVLATQTRDTKSSECSCSSLRSNIISLSSRIEPCSSLSAILQLCACFKLITTQQSIDITWYVIVCL